MTRQRVKCRYCGAIFAATTSRHDEMPRMEEPAFVPRETIVNTAAPAMATAKEAPQLIDDVEILLPGDTSGEHETLAPPARPRMAAISAPPEHLPLTENPAIGKRNEFELDQLIPETPQAEIEAPAPESPEVPEQPQTSEPEHEIIEEVMDTVTEPEAVEAPAVETIASFEEAAFVEIAMPVEKTAEPVEEFLEIPQQPEPTEQIAETDSAVEMGMEAETIEEELVTALGPEACDEPTTDVIEPADETITSTFEEIIAQEELTPAAKEPEPVAVHQAEVHPKSRHYFGPTFVAFAIFTAIAAVGLAWWISRNMETASQPVPAMLVKPADQIQSDKTEITMNFAPEGGVAITSINPDFGKASQTISQLSKTEQLQNPTHLPNGTLNQKLRKFQNSVGNAKNGLINSAMALKTLQAKLAKAHKDVKQTSLAMVQASADLGREMLEEKDKVVIGQNLRDCTRLPDEDGSVILIGLASNNSNETLREILVACDFFTTAGVYAGTARAKLKDDVTTLAAGGQVKYAIVFQASEAGFDPRKIRFAPPRLLAEKRNSAQ